MDVDSYVASRTRSITLRDGTRAIVRPVTAGDREVLLDGFRRASPQTRFMRFLRPMPSLANWEIERLLDLDYVDRFAWGALAGDEPGTPGMGIARYVREDGTDRAEAAVAVVDEYQGRGLATVLTRLLAESAYANGIRAFTALVLGENRSVVDAARRAGAVTESDRDVVRIVVPLPLPDESFPDSALLAALRSVAAGEIQPMAARPDEVGE